MWAHTLAQLPGGPGPLSPAAGAAPVGAGVPLSGSSSLALVELPPCSSAGNGGGSGRATLMGHPRPPLVLGEDPRGRGVQQGASSLLLCRGSREGWSRERLARWAPMASIDSLAQRWGVAGGQVGLLVTSV